MENIELRLKEMEKRGLIRSKSAKPAQVGLYHYYHTDFYYSMLEISTHCATADLGCMPLCLCFYFSKNKNITKQERESLKIENRNPPTTRKTTPTNIYKRLEKKTKALIKTDICCVFFFFFCIDAPAAQSSVDLNLTPQPPSSSSASLFCWVTSIAFVMLSNRKLVDRTTTASILITSTSHCQRSPRPNNNKIVVYRRQQQQSTTSCNLTSLSNCPKFMPEWCSSLASPSSFVAQRPIM
uniref:Uncharacterized protein n=1 Tax=Musca domestica TaxID=7370 RepID=A0A1I8NL11_MUSDO